jgi:hypothetical protein
MALSPKLELRQSQGLVMTPQLMQAIKLLQMSSLDLAAYVESELERNPLLERDSEEQDGDGTAPRSQEQAAAEPGDLVSAARDGSVESITENLDADFGNVYDSDGRPGESPAEPPPDSGWAGRARRPARFRRRWRQPRIHRRRRARRCTSTFCPRSWWRSEAPGGSSRVISSISSTRPAISPRH